MTDNEKEIMQEKINEMALKIIKLEEQSATYFDVVSNLSIELGEIKLSKIMNSEQSRLLELSSLRKIYNSIPDNISLSEKIQKLNQKCFQISKIDFNRYSISLNFYIFLPKLIKNSDDISELIRIIQNNSNLKNTIDDRIIVSDTDMLITIGTPYFVKILTDILSISKFHKIPEIQELFIGNKKSAIPNFYMMILNIFDNLEYNSDFESGILENIELLSSSELLRNYLFNIALAKDYEAIKLYFEMR